MKIQLPSNLFTNRLLRPRIYGVLSVLILLLTTGNSFAVNSLVYSNCSNFSTNGGFPIFNFSSSTVAQDCANMGTGILGDGVVRKVELIKVFSRSITNEIEHVIYDVRQTFTENGSTQTSEGTYISTYEKFCPIGFELANSTDQCIQVTCDSGEAWNSDSEQCEASPKQESCPSTPNPISILTGYKYKQQTDIPTSIHNLGFQRYYRSAAIYGLDTVFGGYWRHQYEQQIKLHLSGNSLEVVTANGRRLPFQKSGNIWIGDTDSTSTLSELLDGTSTRIGWQHHTNNNRIELYNADGQITSISYLDGDKLTFDYALDQASGGDDNTLTLDKVTDNSGHSIQFTYTGYLLTSIMSQDGLTYAYEYDGANHLIKVIYPDETLQDNTDNPFLTYHYEDTNFPAAVTGITDEKGQRTATWRYDAQGRAISSELGASDSGISLSVMDYTYMGDPVDPRVTETNALGKQTTYHYTTVAGVRKVTQVEGHASINCAASNKNTTYDTNGFPASTTDWEGSLTTHIYNTRGLEEERTEAVGTPAQRKIVTQWHASYRVPTQIDVYDKNNLHLKRTVLAYYASGQLETRTESDVITNETREISYTYDPVTHQLKTMDGPRVDVNDLTTNDYDPATGNLIKVTNALGHETIFSNHDANGRPKTVTDPNGLVTTLSYHPRGWLLTRTIDGNTTTFDYDNVGQLDKLTLPTNAFIDYTYDAAHRLTDITDNLGNTIHYTLDPMGNRTKEETKDNNDNLKRILEREYDELSNLLLLVGGEDQLTRYAYDLNGNQTALTDPRNTGIDRDTAKNLDPLQTNNTSQSLYDALNRLVEVTQLQAANNNADDVTTGYEYNALDQLEKVIDPNGLETIYTYNAVGDLLQLNSPDTGITDYGYDEAGNRLTQTDARGVTTSYTYNALNQLITVSYPDNSLNITYTYHQNNNNQNGVGRLTTMTDNSGQTQYHYDKRGKITIKTVTIDNLVSTFEYDYNAADQLTEIIYPSGKVINYHYNASGQIDSVTLTEAGVTTTLADNISYAPFGPMTSLDYGNGMPLTRQYDQDYRLSNNTQGTVINQTYDYDLANNIDEITDHLNASHHQSLEYDGLSRLIYSDGQSGSKIFNYDDVGNRTNLTDDGQSDSYSYVLGSHRLDQITGSNTAQYGYDANGNITSHPDSSFTYGDHNRISTTDTQSYTYNGKGERVKKTGTETLYYDYDPSGHLLAERDGNGDIIKEYVFLNGTLLVQLTENTDPVPIPDPYPDSDGDGIPDSWELQYGLDPQNPNDAGIDTDNDGFTNLQEYQARTDPTDPSVNPDNNPAAWMIPIRSLLLN